MSGTNFMYFMTGVKTFLYNFPFVTTHLRRCKKPQICNQGSNYRVYLLSVFFIFFYQVTHTYWTIVKRLVTPPRRYSKKNFVRYLNQKVHVSCLVVYCSTGNCCSLSYICMFKPPLKIILTLCPLHHVWIDCCFYTLKTCMQTDKKMCESLQQFCGLMLIFLDSTWFQTFFMSVYEHETFLKSEGGKLSTNSTTKLKRKEKRRFIKYTKKRL